MKRLKVLLLTLASFCLSLSSCGNNKGKNTNPGPSNKRIVELVASYDSEVEQGNTLNFSYLSVVAIYSDESIEEIKSYCAYYIDETHLINIHTFVFNEPGNIPVLAKYKTFASTFFVNVTANQSSSLHDVYFETKEVFDYKGSYTILFGFSHNGVSERWEMSKVSSGLYHFTQLGI